MLDKTQDSNTQLFFDQIKHELQYNTVNRCIILIVYNEILTGTSSNLNLQGGIISTT